MGWDGALRYGSCQAGSWRGRTGRGVMDVGNGRGGPGRRPRGRRRCGTGCRTATDERVDLGAEDAVDDAGRWQVGRLLKGCNGGTNKASALRAAHGRFSRSAATQRVLFVLGDGQPDNVEAAMRKAFGA